MAQHATSRPSSERRNAFLQLLQVVSVAANGGAHVDDACAADHPRRGLPADRLDGGPRPAPQRRRPPSPGVERHLARRRPRHRDRPAPPPPRDHLRVRASGCPVASSPAASPSTSRTSGACRRTMPIASAARSSTRSTCARSRASRSWWAARCAACSSSSRETPYDGRPNAPRRHGARSGSAGTHHGADPVRGGADAGPRGGRDRQRRQDGVPLAHEPRAAHAADRRPRLRGAARHGDAAATQERGYVEAIEKGGNHLLALINDVLDVSRLEKGELRLSVEPVDVGDGDPRGGRADAASRRHQRRHRARASCRAGCPAIALGDNQALRQVMLNLVANGIKYNRAGGTVIITDRRRPRRGRFASTSPTPAAASPPPTSARCSHRSNASGRRAPWRAPASGSGSRDSWSRRWEAASPCRASSARGRRISILLTASERPARPDVALACLRPRRCRPRPPAHRPVR